MRDNPDELQDILSTPDRAEAIYRLLALLEDSPPEFRQVVVEGWDFGARWEYPAVERLACSRGERHLPRERIAAVLLAEALPAAPVDERDRTVNFVFLHHACLAAGLSPREVFHHVADMVGRNRGEPLREFAARGESKKRLKDFLITRTVNPDGESEFHLPRVVVADLLAALEASRIDADRWRAEQRLPRRDRAT